MNFNNRNFNPKIWDAPRGPAQFNNNQPPPGFNNNFNNHNQFRQQFPQNFPGPQQPTNQMRPHFSYNMPPMNENNNFRKFNNQRNNNNPRGRNNFQNQQGPRRNKDNRNNDLIPRLDDTFDNLSNSSLNNDERIMSPTNNEESRPKSLVEQLKSTMKKGNNPPPQTETNNDNVDAFAKNASMKLLNQIKTMNKGNVKELINNPKQPHRKAVLNIQAREKLREGMRKQLKTLGEGDPDAFLEADESANFENIPQTLIAQIGQELGCDDMELCGDEETPVNDKDMEVIEKNLGNDFLFGSEQLLMNGFNLLGENEADAPPLPSEPLNKPPEPVPAPILPPDVAPAIVNPWSSPPPGHRATPRFKEEDWEGIELARNPDPPQRVQNPPQIVQKIPQIVQKPPQIVPKPTTPIQTIPVITSVRSRSITPVDVSVPATPKPDFFKTEPIEPVLKPILPADDENVPQTPQISAEPEQSNPEPSQQQQQQHEPQKSNETYGDYKRRINPPNERPLKNNFNRPKPRGPQGPPSSSLGDWDDNDRLQNSNNDNWNRRNNNNNNNDRKSRFEQNRARERNNNNNNQRSNSRDQWEEKRTEEMDDGFNYRFSSSNEGGDFNRLKNIFTPKTQFKGSFNKNARTNFRDQNSRERTPTNNEGEFENLTAAPSTSGRLKKVMEIDHEITGLHDKILGIDKVILNLQSERVNYQKKFSQLLHDRKVIIENLSKRAHHNDSNVQQQQLREKSRDKEKSREKSPVISHKASTSKKLEKMVEQKKRKANDLPAPVEEPVKKKKILPLEEPKSADQLKREQLDKATKERIDKMRKEKQARKERAEAERRKLEEEAMKESNDGWIKLGNVEKKSQQPKPVQNVIKSPPKILLNSNEILQVSNYKLKNPAISLKKYLLPANIIDDYKKCEHVSADLSEWKKWGVQPKIEIKCEEVEPATNNVQILNEPDRDPLAFDDNQPLTNPPTPGNHLITSNNDDDDENLASYDEWTGNFETHKTPIVYLQNIDNTFMVCAAEDGKLIKYRLASGEVDAVFTKHSQICNSFIYDAKDNLLYTASSDGIVYRIKFKDFNSINSKNFNESLQVIEKSKSTVFIGAKSGNIFRIRSDLSVDEEDEDSSQPLCCVDGLILCLKASKEGARSVILVASRGKAIQVRDAKDGLLLRTLANEMANFSVYDMALDGNTIYCGCNSHEIFAIDFTNGALQKKRTMLGAGAICVKIYKTFLIAACYDGNIYIFDMNSDDDVCVNITGPSNMLLAMDLWEGRIIASTKDKTVKIINIPT